MVVATPTTPKIPPTNHTNRLPVRPREPVAAVANVMPSSESPAGGISVIATTIVDLRAHPCGEVLHE